MKLSTKIAKEQMRQKISSIAVEFANKYARCTPEEIPLFYREFNVKLMDILNLKI